MKFLSTRTNRAKLPDSYACPGIYRIQCLANGKTYIGSTGISIRKRWGQHTSALSKGTHVNPNMQASWNKYGEDAFVFGVVEYCDADISVAREDHYIKLWNPEFNYGPAANPRRGVKLTVDQKAYISQRLKECMTPARREQNRQSSKMQDKTTHVQRMRQKNRKPIVDQDGFIWGSVQLAAAYYNINPCVISHNLVGRTQLVRKKYTFKYLKG